MQAMVVGKFCMGDQFCPQSGVVSAEDSKIVFNFLIDLFSFSVRLGVIDSREREIIIKESA